MVTHLQRAVAVVIMTVGGMVAVGTVAVSSTVVVSGHQGTR